MNRYKIQGLFNQNATRTVEDNSYGRELTLDQVNLALFSADFVKEPTTYEEALNCECKEDQMKWKDRINYEFKATNRELKEIMKRGVREVTDEKISQNLQINLFFLFFSS
jgi:hypothetical protein